MSSRTHFEWDEAKALSNLAKHGIAFDQALRLFAVDGCIEADATRENDGELRTKRIGMLFGHLITVVFTRRGEGIRLVSARRANKGEEKRYGDRATPDRP